MEAMSQNLRNHHHPDAQQRKAESPIWVVLLFLAFLVVLPIWTYNKDWGVQPALTLGLILMVVAAMTFRKNIQEEDENK
jgi:hypothetical protein